MNIRIQTMKLDLVNSLCIYKEPSKIWEINKDKLLKFTYFNNLIKFNKKNNIFLINEISDKEMELFLNYINHGSEFIMELETNDIMLLIKISDFLIIPELLKLAKIEFFNRL